MSLHSGQSSAAVRPTRQKGTLFCPSCGHDSHVDGDWLVREGDDCVAYDCPVCDTTLTERPRWDESRPAASTPHDAPLGGSLVARSVRLTFTWTSWPYSLAASTLRSLP